MRYKPEHKEETHQRIVETASQEFRTNGFDGVGIARLMGLLNLTHGGFYAHFPDKEALVAEASVFALEQSLENMLEGLRAGGFPALLDYYLSPQHRDRPESGCLLSALSAEVARHSLAARERFTATLIRVFDTIAQQMQGSTAERKREKVQVMFATLTGALSLARAVSDAKLSEAILDATRQHLLRFIAED